jgi:hypothetical protein
LGYLVQVLLPLFGRSGEAVGAGEFQRVKDELTQLHGGLTAFTSAPAEGRWTDDDNGVAHDKVVLFEVMADTLDRRWWQDYRADLERRFDQDEIVVRVQTIERL